MDAKKSFLTAEWRNLAMLNYEVDHSILEPRLPPGTELDLWRGKALVSIVGFMFLKTKIFGVPIPLYQNFEEVNLRFYVKRETKEGTRRGVVFIKEMVPRWAVAQVARTIYNENYIALPMDHSFEEEGGVLKPGAKVEYAWRVGPRWHRLHVKASGNAAALTTGSEEEFITEHYWGYATQRDKGCMEYPVEHAPWRIWQVSNAYLETDVAALYGEEFAGPLSGEPASALLAEGSPVTVYCGRRLCGTAIEDAALMRVAP